MTAMYDFIPFYPIEDYINWSKEQDQKILSLNAAMWSKLHIKLLRKIHNAKLQANLDLGQETENFIEFCMMSYIVHSYHNVIDGMVREEIEEMCK